MYFGNLNMPPNVFGKSSSSQYNSKKTDISVFVQKLYLRTNYIETTIEENIDFKIQIRIRNLPDPISNREAASNNNVDNLFNDPSMIKNNTHVDSTDKISVMLGLLK